MLAELVAGRTRGPLFLADNSTVRRPPHRCSDGCEPQRSAPG